MDCPLKRRSCVATRRGAVLACVLAAWLGASAPARAADSLQAIADEVFASLQGGRVEAGAPPLSRLSQLDVAARRRAEQVAALPHAERLTVADPIGTVVREAGIDLYRNVTLHLDMQRGYAHPASAFYSNWSGNAAWKTAIDPRFASAGLAIARGADGWLVLAAVLLEPLPVPHDPAAVESETLVAINAKRDASALAPLAVDSELTEVARRHSRDMAARDFFAHESPEGRRVGDRMREAGLRFRAVAENIYRARGMDDPAGSAVEAWMDSPGHRENILDGRFARTGVGVAVDASGNVYFTQVFLAP